MKDVGHSLGYQKELCILAFDHRGSFMSKLFGIKDRAPTPAEAAEVASYKDIVYEGFKKALTQGVAREKAGILVDEQFGSKILEDAARSGVAFASPAEKSGQDEFDFEYGREYGAHIDRFKPTFVKVLVRYNTEDDAGLNRRQAERLKALSEFCQKSGRRFIFELLVPATDAQLKRAGGDKARFDAEVRPDYVVAGMRELVKAGVEPDVWKLEGLESRADCEKVAAVAREGGRSKVGVVVLGRGENDAKVEYWLKTARGVPGFIGFAVGRTIFWDALKGLREKKHSREDAVNQIAGIYAKLCKLWDGR